jgi:hypothetical protein
MKSSSLAMGVSLATGSQGFGGAGNGGCWLTAFNSTDERFAHDATGYSRWVVGFRMKHGFVLALAAALSACAPAPIQMPAARAAEVLNLFAAGAGPANICSSNGRALLRGAVQSYSREMAQSGIAWPVIPQASEETENVTSVDISVMIAFAAGFVKTSDFQARARGMLAHLTFAQWPEIQSMRSAAEVACADVQALQQAASSFVVEQSRMAQMVHAAHLRGQATSDRLRGQSARLERAQTRMNESAAVLDARMRAAGV